MEVFIVNCYRVWNLFYKCFGKKKNEDRRKISGKMLIVVEIG